MDRDIGRALHLLIPGGEPFRPGFMVQNGCSRVGSLALHTTIISGHTILLQFLSPQTA
jgi:hypothetical protein